MVRVHPVTGRKVLFVNPQFTVAIKNMDERESRSLLDILFQQAQIPEYQFRHHWAPHTLIMWDNRSTQHYAVNDYFPQRRYMERVTIKGGPVDGVARADPENVRKAIRRGHGSADGRARQAAGANDAGNGQDLNAATFEKVTSCPICASYWRRRPSCCRRAPPRRKPGPAGR